MALRKTKSGEKPVNIRPLAIDVHAEGEALFARLMLTERDTLKPDLLINTLAERAGTQFATSEHVRFLQDQTVFRGTARYDGGPSIAEAFVAFGLNNTTPNATMTFASDDANASS